MLENHGSWNKHEEALQIKQELDDEEPKVKKEILNEEEMHAFPVLRKGKTDSISSVFPIEDKCLYCGLCKMKYEGDCPKHGPHIYVDSTEVTNSRTQTSSIRHDTYVSRNKHMELPEQPGFCEEDGEMYSCVQRYHSISNHKIMQMHLKIVPTEKHWTPRKHDKVDDLMPASKINNLVNKKECISRIETVQDSNSVSDIAENEDSFLCTVNQKVAVDICETPDVNEVALTYKDSCSETEKVLSLTENKPEPCGVNSSSHTQNNMVVKSREDMYTCEKPYMSGVCGEGFTQKISLGKHKRFHAGETSYKCDFCGISFTHSDRLQTHKRAHAGEKPNKCNVCDLGFTYSSQLQAHKRIHTGEKPYKFEVCGVGFSRCGGLKSHKRVHTEDKPYKCDICDAEFTQSGSLKTHKRMHTGEKPYKCDVCGVGFTRCNSLNTHIRIHTGEKPYKCDVCNGDFTRSDHLITHKRIHTGEKPYKCDICGAGFSQSSEVKIHKRIHTGEKPYKCGVCGVAFARSDGLKIHTRNHTGEKPFRCDICGVCFAQSSHLTRHSKKHTKPKPTS